MRQIWLVVFSFQGESYDLHAMGQHRTDVVLGAAQGDGSLVARFLQGGQIAGDGACADEEDAVGQVFGGEQAALAECFLTEVGNPGLSKCGGSLFFEQGIILVAAMDGETNGLLLTFGDGLSSGLVGGDDDQGDFAWWQVGLMLIEQGKVNFLDDLQDGLGLEGRAIQPLTDFVSKAIFESYTLKPLQQFLGPIANTHSFAPSRKWPIGIIYHRSDICLEGRLFPAWWSGCSPFWTKLRNLFFFLESTGQKYSAEILSP